MMVMMTTMMIESIEFIASHRGQIDMSRRKKQR